VSRESTTRRLLVIACGALARELMTVIRANGWAHVQVTCLPPHLHNRPEHIPQAVRECIHANRRAFEHIFVAYGDCGTGGGLDRVLEEEGVERLPGAHCYAFFTGTDSFARLADEEPGTFYLTDFLVHQFDRLVMRGLGLDRHPQLLPVYFQHYRRVVYLAQRHDADLEAKAARAAERLGLPLEVKYTGLAPLARALRPMAFRSETDGTSHHGVLA